MTDPINKDTLNAHFEKMKQQAESIIEDPDEVKNLAEKAWEKAKQLKEPMEQVWEQLKSMIALIRAWFAGEYKETPTTSIIAIIAGLTYFLSPIDLIPDFIPLLGYLDDVFIIGVVFTQIAKDIEAFENWLAAKKTPEQKNDEHPATVVESANEAHN